MLLSRMDSSMLTGATNPTHPQVVCEVGSCKHTLKAAYVNMANIRPYKSHRFIHLFIAAMTLSLSHCFQGHLLNFIVLFLQPPLQLLPYSNYLTNHWTLFIFLMSFLLSGLWILIQLNNNNNIYLLQLGSHPVAVVILHVNTTWNWLLLNLSR